MKNLELINIAQRSTTKAFKLSSSREDWKYMGYVGAALETSAGNIFTGVNLELYCGIGFCAEHSAIAEMLKNGETKIQKIVAVTNDGMIIPPCGRCRELIYQIDAANIDTLIILDEKYGPKKLIDLLPFNW